MKRLRDEPERIGDQLSQEQVHKVEGKHSKNSQGKGFGTTTGRKVIQEDDHDDRE